MRDDLEQTIRDAEAELAALRRTMALRIDAALQARERSMDVLVATRDRHSTDLERVRRDLKLAQRRRDAPGRFGSIFDRATTLRKHQFALIFTGWCWLYGSLLPLSLGELAPVMLRLAAGAALAGTTWLVTREHR